MRFSRAEGIIHPHAESLLKKRIMTENKKTVLITGASRGIGRACALELARTGHALVLNSRKPSEEMDETVRLCEAAGAQVRTLFFDVGSTEAARAAIEADIGANGAYWGVVLNAGVTRDNAFPALEEEDWKRVIDVDLNGFYNVIHPAVMPMVRARKGGRIVTMSSVSGVGNRGQTNYSAAKAGLIGASKALAVELAKRRITVNCVAPGLIDTGMVDMNDIAREHAMAMIPMQRIGTPEEVAAVVGFLMDDRASYVTRQVINVNGGMI